MEYMQNETERNSSSVVGTTVPLNDDNNRLFDKTRNRVFREHMFAFIAMDFVIMLPTIIGNMLILLSLVRFRRTFKSTSYVLVGNLAASDLLVGTVLLPVDVSRYLADSLANSEAFCLCHHAVVLIAIGTSVMNLFLLSLERFHAIIRPLRHAAVFTRRRIYIAIAAMWAVMTVYGLWPLFNRLTEGEVDGFLCLIRVIHIQPYHKIFCFIVVTSMIANTIFFFIIIRVVVKKSSASTVMRGTLVGKRNGLKGSWIREYRHTWMMLIVSGLFVVFWGPFCVLSLIPDPSEETEYILAWLTGFGLLNSCVNWLVYGYRSTHFRKAFKNLVTCKCK